MIRSTLIAVAAATVLLLSSVTLGAALAGPASAKPYPPPSIHLVCTGAPTDGTLVGTLCVLPWRPTGT
jgi:hypothetical protein